jgi:basic membrane lipoprotein Med (substrate-binding protein (PBP1-ABC) superfamily)
MRPATSRLMAQNDHGTTVSSRAGIPVPAVVRYIAGYQAGAKGPCRASRC